MPLSLVVGVWPAKDGDKAAQPVRMQPADWGRLRARAGIVNSAGKIPKLATKAWGGSDAS